MWGRLLAKLSATRVASLKDAGRYHDGDGLMLVIGKAGSRSWILRVKEPGSHGKRRDFGLGSFKDVSLADARKRAASIREQVKNGESPNAWWRKEADPTPTFRKAAERLHGELKGGWKNGKHQDQWLSTLETHVFPRLGDRTLDTIDAGDIRDALLPIWLEIPETARRVRQRIAAVLDWGHAKGYRATEAPMRSVSKTLPRQMKRVSHFAAMPYADVPAFIARLRERSSLGRMAVELVILTATRSGEVRGARWSELSLDAGRWTIPAERMKAGVEHVVPLAPPAVDLLKRLHEIRRGDLVFPGSDARKPLSDMTLTKVLRDMDVPFTVHGFRSSFRDWVAERTKFPGEVAEAALAHTVPDKVEAAYRRTSFFDKRVELMKAWGRYLGGAGNNVVEMASRRVHEKASV
jgi:integrase